MPGNVSQYQLPQTQRSLSIGRPLPLMAVGGDNGTPFYLKFPGLGFGLQWVQPFTYGFMYPLTVPQVAPLIVQTDQTPDGFPAALAGSNLTAKLSAYDTPQVFSPGITSKPGVGVVQIPVSIVAGMAAGATVVLVNGVAGQTLYIIAGTAGFDATSTGINLEDTNGTSRYNFPDTATDHTLDLKGAPIGPVGTGARLHNTSGVTVNVRGTLTYGQA